MVVQTCMQIRAHHPLLSQLCLSHRRELNIIFLYRFIETGPTSIIDGVYGYSHVKTPAMVYILKAQVT